MFFLIGWKRVPVYSPLKQSGNSFISILIPFRNEENNLPVLIESLNNLMYSRSFCEIIFINDHSEDNSVKIIENSHIDFSHSLLHMQESIEGKKKAIWYGIKASRGDIIITTDADCTHPPGWLKAISGFMSQKNHDFVIGPVLLEEKPGFWNIFQRLEFLSLVASTGGAAGIHKPIMCNGANLAYKKHIALNMSHILGAKFLSGDDIMILHEIKKTKEIRVGFLKSKQAIIRTKGTSCLLNYIYQRKRWTSKSRFYKDRDTIITALIVSLINFTLLFTFFAGLFNLSLLIVFSIIFLLKSTIDYFFLKEVSSFFNQKKIMRFLLPVQFIYFFYISFIILISFFGGFEWKNRKVN
ncbi:MAG: glycosyltransferase [Bacteroidales bacterium]